MLDITKIDVRDQRDRNDQGRRFVYARITCTEMVPYSVPALKSDEQIIAAQATRRAVTELWQRFYADLLPSLIELRFDAVKFLDDSKAREVDEKFETLIARLSDPSDTEIEQLFVKREERPVAP